MPREYIRSIQAFSNIFTRGPVLLYDNMEGTLKWEATGNAGNFSASKSTQYPFYDTYSLKLTSRSTDAAEDDYVEGYRTLVLKPGLIAEASFFAFMPNQDRVKNLDFTLIYDDESAAQGMSVRYTPSSGKWYYLNSEGTYTEIPDAAQILLAQSFMFVKFSANFSSSKYLKLVANGQEFDLSEHTLYSEATQSVLYSGIYIKATAAGANAAVVHIDDLLITEGPFF